VLRRVITGAVILGMCAPGLWESRAVAIGAVERGESLTPTEAMRAFGVVEGWVRSGEVCDPAAALPAVHGAAVTLRVDGRVVGRGVAFSDAADDVPAIRRAAGDAIGEARGAVPRARDALQQGLGASDFWSRAMVSVEFAGPLVPMSVATFEEADAEVRPGIEGVAARAGSRVEAVFPEAMLMRNIGPGDALSNAITRALDEPGVALREDPAGQPGTLAESRGVRLYRFRTVHVVSGEPGRGAMFLDRCGRVVRDWPRSTGDIRDWAGAMARNIEARRRVENGKAKYAGVYRPVTGAFEASGAGWGSALEEILAARALLAYGRAAGVEGAGAALAAAVEIVDAVAARGAGERAASDDAGSAALWCCVVPQVAAARGMNASHDAAWPVAWRESYGRSLEVLHASAADLSRVPEAQRAVVAFALARRSVEPWPGGGDAGAARAALDAVAAGTEPGLLAARMPWLGWGEICMEGATIGAAPALRDLREMVYAHQLRAEAMDPDHEDLSGGIVFTASQSPLPTWQGARVAAFLASALGDPRLTDGPERVKETARLTATLRFLRQLTADEACGFMYADPGRAAGGVRAAPWDQRQPLEATALSLIAACEVLRVTGASAGTPRGPGSENPGAR